jgi:hypothetical protein
MLFLRSQGIFCDGLRVYVPLFLFRSFFVLAGILVSLDVPFASAATVPDERGRP